MSVVRRRRRGIRGGIRRRHSDDGQSTVELALGLPLVVLFALAIVQLAVVVADMLQVHAASREGARAAAASGSPGSAGASAAQGVTGKRSATVDVAASGDTVTVRVSRVNHTDVPLIGALLPDVTLSATVTMAVEPP